MNVIEPPIKPVSSDESADSRPAAGRSRGKVAREWALVTLFFTVIGCYFTWPVLTHMSSGMYGFGNDNWGGIWFIHWLHDAFWGPGKTAFAPQIEFPFGFAFDDRFIQPYDRLFSIVFGGIGGGLFAYNLMILISFPMAGMSMYAFGRYLTGNRTAALLAGVIFAASPFHLAMAMQYPAMACIFPIPLLGMTMIRTFRTQKLSDAAWMGAALALTWLTSYYYGWFAIWFVLVFTVAVAVIGLFNSVRARRAAVAVRDAAKFTVTRGAVVGATFLVISLPVLISLVLKVLNDPGVYARAADDLTFTAVRPWMYLLPPHDNPLIHFKRLAIYSHQGILPIYEQSVYLGLIPALLAIIAIFTYKKASADARFAMLPLFVAAAFCVLLTFGTTLPLNPFSINNWINPSAHPHISGPVNVLYSISKNFRYYGRAFVFVSMVLAAFAAIGFANVSPRVAKRYGRNGVWVVGGLLMLIVLVEFNNRPPQRYVDLSSPPWLTTIEQLPKSAVIMEYPDATYSSPRSLQYVYWQTRHNRTTVNPPESIQSQNFMTSLDDPDSYLAGRALSKAGVQYVVVHTKLDSPTYPPYQPAWPSDQMPRSAGSKNPWFEPYKRTSDVVIYKVRKTPRIDRGAVIGFGGGWGTIEIDETGTWRWGLKDTSVVPIFSAQNYSRASIQFKMTSFSVPRIATFKLDGKQVLRQKISGKQIASIRIPVSLHRGLQTLTVSTTPGPVMVDKVLHNLDQRTLTVRMTKPRVVTPGN